MSFFKRRKVHKNPVDVDTTISIEEVYVATASVIPSYDDGNGGGPRCVTWYFLVKAQNTGYHELFSGKKLEMYGESSKFDTPYIKKIEPLKDYLTDESIKEIDKETLFDFILMLDIQNFIKA